MPGAAAVGTADRTTLRTGGRPGGRTPPAHPPDGRPAGSRPPDDHRPDDHPPGDRPRDHPPGGLPVPNAPSGPGVPSTSGAPGVLGASGVDGAGVDDTAQSVPSDGSAAPDRTDAQILSLLLLGLTDTAVAKQLDLGVRTVQRRVRGLMDRAGVSTRFQLGWYAARNGWLAGSGGSGACGTGGAMAAAR